MISWSEGTQLIGQDYSVKGESADSGFKSFRLSHVRYNLHSWGFDNLVQILGTDPALARASCIGLPLC